MALIFGLILSFVLGFFILAAIAPQTSILEKIGLSFVIGIGVQTFLMVVLDFIGIPLTITYIFSISFLVVFVALFFCYRNKDFFISAIKSFSFKDINFRQYTILWLIVLGILGYTEFLNISKCLYFPTFDRDSVVAFDFMGRVIGNEHCIKASTYYANDIYNLKGASYVNYVPLVHLSYAYVYILGAETSKIVNALFFLSFIVSFYAVLRNRITPTFAILATLFMVLVPEFLSFTSLSNTNILFAVYASLSVIYAWLCFNTKKQYFLYLTIILSCLSVWTRQEGLAFIGAIGILMLIEAIRTKKYKNLFLFSGISLAPFIFWLLFLKINSIGSQTQSLILKPFWDAEKFNTIKTMLFELLENTTLYSLSLAVFAVAVVISLYPMYKQKANYQLPAMFIGALLLLCIIIYQVEYNWDTLEHVMQHSVKRFLFCFTPIACAFVFTSPYMLQLNDFIEKKLQ